MHDIEVIARRNAEAIQQNIPRLQQQGKWVVAEYSGLHFIGYESFSGDDAEQDARAAIEALNARNDGTHGKLYEPIADAAPSSSEPVPHHAV